MTDLIHIHTDARELAPGDLLHTDPSRNQLLRVSDGIVYVRHDDDDEAVLVAGDAMTLAAGAARRIWNAGDETARVFVSETSYAQVAKAA